MEQRGAGLREQVRETWPDTERTKTMTTGLTRFTQRSHSGEDSNWEPDGVTHHVRFCEGPGVTVGWLRSCGTAGKPGGNREDKHQPVPLGEPGLLTKSWGIQMRISPACPALGLLIVRDRGRQAGIAECGVYIIKKLERRDDLVLEPKRRFSYRSTRRPYYSLLRKNNLIYNLLRYRV